MNPECSGNPHSPTWDHTGCPGLDGSPARSPRFYDKEGTLLLITPGAEGEFETLVDFYDNYPSRDRSMSLPPLTRPQIESWVSRLMERGRNILAFHDDTLVGHVAYLAAETDEPEIIVFVDHEYQGRGLGTELCRQAMAYAAADGHSALRLHVDEDNTVALAVYRELGFVDVEQNGKRIEMRLALDAERVEEVQASPAQRT